jgi:signal transduction histidine kinase/DNA-binding CsgD family transcriptional regulator
MSRADEQSNFELQAVDHDRWHVLSSGTGAAPLLAQRQREIVSLVAQGLTNEQIGAHVVVTAGTVANHVADVLARLNLKSRTQIATWAVEHGLSGSQDRLLTTLERLLEVQATSLASAMTEAASLIAEVLGAEKVDAFLHEEEIDTLVAVGASHTPMGRKQRGAGLDRQPIANGGRAVYVFQTGECYLDGSVDKDTEELIGVKQTLGVRSQIAVPLDIGGTRHGVLSAQSVERDAFSDRDLQFLQAVSRWVGNVGHRAALAERTAAAAIEQGRRLAAEELITVLAHDLRNHLMPIRGRVGLLRQRAAREQHDANLHDVDRLQFAVDRLGRMITELLDIARIDQGLFELQMEPVDLVTLARETAESIQAPGMSIRVEGPPEVAAIVDPARIRQALENLLANAVQHSPPDTAVSVQVVKEDQLGQVWATIRVSDQGPGIDSALLPRLFERFARSPSSHGLGIGLYLAREIAEAHGGTLEATSSSGSGTQFQLSVPAEGVDLPLRGAATRIT